VKQKPFTRTPGFPAPGAYQAPGQGKTNPQETGDAIKAFVASGGMTTFFFDAGPPGFNPQPEGVQLLCTQYVPRGFTGWIKQLRVAPYAPAALTNPWQGWPGNWQDFEPVGAAVSVYRATAANGLYTTPLGWESYFSLGTEVLAEWNWWLTLLPGPLAKQRPNAGPFSITDPASWYLLENVAVPASVYPQGVPGRAPGGRLEPQRVQVLPGDPIVWHLQIPEDSTACLWASWRQSTVSVRTRSLMGSDLVAVDVPPLLPSYGQMVGYMQATSSPATLDNARHGWGG